MSIFSDLPEASWVAANTHAFAVRDRHPVSPGHTLVITRRATVRDWFEASEDERRELLALVDVVKAELDRGEPRPDGYNVGFNAGEAAGQTVMHLHLHVIPRYAGDVADPRGGIRHVIPGRGNYLAGTAPPPSRALAQVLGAGALTTGGEADRLAAQVLPLFALADDIAIVAAFVQDSGLARIEPALGPALARGAAVRSAPRASPRTSPGPRVGSLATNTGRRITRRSLRRSTRSSMCHCRRLRLRWCAAGRARGDAAPDGSAQDRAVGDALRRARGLLPALRPARAGPAPAPDV